MPKLLRGYEVRLKRPDSQFFNLFGYVQSPQALFDIPGHVSAIRGLEGDDAEIIIGRPLDTVGEWMLKPIYEDGSEPKPVDNFPTPEEWDNAERHDCAICDKHNVLTLRDEDGDERCADCWENY